MVDISPVDKIDDIWVKREDLFEVAGVKGSKARGCWELSEEADGIITAGNIHSMQIVIAAHVAKHRGIHCIIHTPYGKITDEIEECEALGASIVMHRPGYKTVVTKWAVEDAMERGYVYIPFGLESRKYLRIVERQVQNIPKEVKRIVVPVGGGMTLAGVLHGMLRYSINKPVLGVKIYDTAEKVLDDFAPPAWRDMVELVPSGKKHDEYVRDVKVGDILLDPMYEAKLKPFLKEGDLLWNVGIRPSEERKK